MNPNEVPLLSAEMAGDVNLLSTFGKTRALDVRFALDAIATERARVCPVRTEAEWRAEFARLNTWGYWSMSGHSFLVNGTGEPSTDQWRGFLSALRHLKLISEKTDAGS